MTGNIQSKMESADEEIFNDFKDICVELKTLQKKLTCIMNKVKDVENRCKKREKTLMKVIDKSKNKGNRKPSGFAVPTKISPKLCNFMGVEEGTKLARTEVTKYISNYRKENKLQATENKRIILPDKTLETLLGVENNDKVTYFTLQKYMNVHFINETNSVSE